MRSRLMALAAVAFLLIWPLYPGFTATIDSTKQTTNKNSLELPAALAEDDSFEDLPFEQLRQALREEVERNPQKSHTPSRAKKYNLLIR